MRHAFKLTLVFFVTWLGTTPHNAHGESRFELKHNDVVAFLGGTNMVRAQQSGYLEAFLTHQFSAVRPRFRDLSWEADTVFQQGTDGGAVVSGT